MDPVSFTALSAPRPALLRQAGPVRTPVIRKGSFVEQRIAIKDALGRVRGRRLAANKKTVPTSTVGDVIDVAEAWSKAISRFGNKSGDKDKSTRARFARFVRDSVRPSLSLGRSAGFPAKLNEQFWQRELSRVAIWLDGLSAVVPPWRLALDSVVEAIKEAPALTGDKIVALGEAAGAAVAAPVKGLASAFGITPRNVLFGLAVVGAGVVLFRKVKR